MSPRDEMTVDYDPFLDISTRARRLSYRSMRNEQWGKCVVTTDIRRDGQIGAYFVEKYRGRAADAGHRAVATQLRKQGVPLEHALLILLGCEERFTRVRPA
jgi:hypothetical protein